MQLICVCSEFLVGTKKVRYVFTELAFYLHLFVLERVHFGLHKLIMPTVIFLLTCCSCYSCYFALLFFSQQITVLSVKVTVRNPYFYTGYLNLKMLSASKQAWWGEL